LLSKVQKMGKKWYYNYKLNLLGAKMRLETPLYGWFQKGRVEMEVLRVRGLTRTFSATQGSISTVEMEVLRVRGLTQYYIAIYFPIRFM